MSNKAVIGAVVLAILLGALLYALNRAAPSGGGDGGEASPIAFDAGTADRLVFEIPDGEPVTIARTIAGGWEYRAGSPRAYTWPVDPRRVRAFMQALRESAGDRAGDAETPAPGDAFGITIHRTGADPIVVTIATRSVGGRARVWVGGEGPWSMGDQALAMLESTPPAGWRLSKALPDVSRFSVAGLTIEDGSGAIALELVDNRWHIEKPIRARADGNAVRSTIASLAAIDAERFVDTPPDGAQDGDAAREGVRRIEARLKRPHDVEEERFRELPRSRSIRVLGAATPEGDKLLCAAGDGGPRLVIAAEALNAFDADPATYLDRTASGVAQADVGAIALIVDDAETVYQRDLDKWRRIERGTDRGVSALATDEAATVLDFLVNTEAIPRIDNAPLGFTAHARIELRGLEGNTLETLELGHLKSGMHAVRSGAVVYEYANAPLPNPLLALVPDAPEQEGDEKQDQPDRSPIPAVPQR